MISTRVSYFMTRITVDFLGAKEVPFPWSKPGNIKKPEQKQLK